MRKFESRTAVEQIGRAHIPADFQFCGACGAELESGAAGNGAGRGARADAKADAKAPAGG